MGNYGGPEEQRQKGWWHDDRFHQEQDTELLDRHSCEQSLEHPVDKEAEESCRGDTSIGWEMVREILEARPDGLDATLEEGSSLDAENGSPHGSNEGSDADGEV